MCFSIMTHESNQMLITYIIHVKGLVATPLSNNILVKKNTRLLKKLSRGEALQVFAGADPEIFQRGGLRRKI